MTDLLKKIFEAFPKELMNDPFVKQLEDKIYDKIDLFSIDDLFLVEVGQDIYDSLLDQYPDLTYIRLSNHSILKLSLVELKEESISLTVKKKDDKYYIEYWNYFNGKDQRISFSKDLNKSIIEITLKEDQGMDIIDYEYDIQFYDQHYQLIKSVDYRKIKDQYFSEFFGVPIDQAYYLRTHFKENYVLINECLRKVISINKNENISEEELFYFKSPFSILDFQDYINQELDKDAILNEESIKQIYECLGINDIDLPENSNHISIQKIDQIYQNIMQYIGISGKIIMSQNLFYDITSYLIGATFDVLNTVGIIIQLIEDKYMLYYITITNQNVAIIPSSITKEEAQTLYYKNLENKEVEGLKDFFGISRQRNN